MGKRSESLGVVITTQAANDQHPLSQMIDDALLGNDPSIYLQLAAAPKDADIFDEKVGLPATRRWANFSISTNSASQAEQAKRLPSFRAKFKNLRLNQRVDANVQFIGDPGLDGCAAPLDMPELAGKPCHAGLDLSQTTDMSASSFTGRTTGRAAVSSGCPRKACSTAIGKRAATIAPGATPASSRRRRVGQSISRRSSGASPRSGRVRFGARAYDGLSSRISLRNAMRRREVAARGIRPGLCQHGRARAAARGRGAR